MLIIISVIIITIILVLFLYLYRKKEINNAKQIINRLKNKKSTSKSFNDIPKYYINLDRSKDRKKHIEEQIKTYKVSNIERVKAFDGSKIKDLKVGEIDGYRYKNTKTPNCKKSELAITLSHILAINKAFEKNNEHAIIMEDDIDFLLMPYWNLNFNDLLKDIPRDCDILLLAHSGIEKNIKVVSNKIKPTRVSGVCYLVTKKGMEKINKYYNDKEFIFSQKDMLWDWDFLNKMNTYHTSKSLFSLYNFNFLSERQKEFALTFDYQSYNILKFYNNMLD